MAMPESIPAPLIIDTLKDTFREARAARTAEGWPAAAIFLGWILSVPDTHQKTRAGRARQGRRDPRAHVRDGGRGGHDGGRPLRWAASRSC